MEGTGRGPSSLAEGIATDRTVEPAWMPPAQGIRGRRGRSGGGLEEHALGGLAEEPFLVVVGEEIEAIANEGEAVGVLAGDDLERAIALPHAAPGAEGLNDTLDEGGEVGVRR